jgi:hypothetical protein
MLNFSSLMSGGEGVRFHEKEGRNSDTYMLSPTWGRLSETTITLELELSSRPLNDARA